MVVYGLWSLQEKRLLSVTFSASKNQLNSSGNFCWLVNLPAKVVGVFLIGEGLKFFRRTRTFAGIYSFHLHQNLPVKCGPLPFSLRNSQKSFKDQNIILDIPGVPPMPSSDMAKPLLDCRDKAYDSFLACAANYLCEFTRIIVYTFES
ncbi:hypothetical protein F8388_026413 [Cannabis sativa]|uniref:Uncharacterized protein n=1 Tax=Cannabis sativa TaxID=3483 RepID=A0A7J6ETF4_CANSA|nr:hypothetical protein F8388_026413 [Cannabis sativa]